MESNDSKNKVNRREVMRVSLNTVAGPHHRRCIGHAYSKVETPKRWSGKLDPKRLYSMRKNVSTNCVLAAIGSKNVFTPFRCVVIAIYAAGILNPVRYPVDTGAESQLCPTGAIQRKFIEDPYFQYTIDEELCIGCGKCVKRLCFFR